MMINVYIVSCVFLLFDIIAGLVAAAKNSSLSSTIMRDGLYNKFAELMLLAFAMFCNFILEMEPFVRLGIPSEIMYMVVIYIIGMEILSIIENICKINPDLSISKILAIFNIDVDNDNSDDVDSD